MSWKRDVVRQLFAIDPPTFRPSSQHTANAMNTALDLRTLHAPALPCIVDRTYGRGGHPPGARRLPHDQQLIRRSLRQALARILPQLPEHPGLVASGTLTPECFLACFEPARGYFRFQHVLRPLDARGSGSKLHSALFEQCQVVLGDSHDTVLDMAKWLLSRFAGQRAIDCSAATLPWHADSIAARGVGTEVFLEGIEVAQVNAITHMGGHRLERPLCLLAIGLRRIDVALRASVSSLQPAPESPTNFLVHRLFELRGGQARRASSCDLLMIDADDAALPIASQLARLGDIQTEMEFQYAIGTIASGYRRKIIQRLRDKYRALAQVAMHRPPERRHVAGHTYLPVWTLTQIARLTRPTRDAMSQRAALTRPTSEMLQNMVSYAQRGVPAPSAWRTSVWTREEFAAVVTCEWSQSPDAMASFGRQVETESGSGAVRLQRLQRGCWLLLHRLGRLDTQAKGVVDEYFRVMLIEAASFIRRAAPSACALNTVGHLRHWNASERTLQIATWRSEFWSGGKLEPANVAVLCAALAELGETLVLKMGRDGERYSSCRDPWRLKRSSRSLVRIARASGVDARAIRDLMRCFGRELRVTQAVADQVFAQSYLRFAK